MSYDNSAADPTRVGNWMQTFTGRAFWPADPRPEDVDVEDIAHALSMQCRYGGHAKRFYSVAEHSFLISCSVPREDQLWGLLHDASEAYLVDIPRPVKYLPGFREAYLQLESGLMAVICERFGLRGTMPETVKLADNRILLDERDQVMESPPFDWALGELEPLGVSLRCWDSGMSKMVFLDRLRELL